MAISKALIFDEEQYRTRAESLLATWSQEEAEALVKEVCWQLPPSDNVHGMFRHGRRLGLQGPRMRDRGLPRFY